MRHTESAERSPGQRGINRGEPYQGNRSLLFAVTYFKIRKQVVFENPDLEQTEYSETGKPMPNVPPPPEPGPGGKRSAEPRPLGPLSPDAATKHIHLPFLLKNLENVQQLSQESHQLESSASLHKPPASEPRKESGHADPAPYRCLPSKPTSESTSPLCPHRGTEQGTGSTLCPKRTRQGWG